MGDDSSNSKRRHALVATTVPITWRSHSAPPRKKWYRRGPLLNRQRSTTQQSGTMLYDQMVARRLVSAIAAWHDLHASLLQLSLRATEDDDGDAAAEGRRRAKRASRACSRASSICSTIAVHGRKRTSARRITTSISRTASGRRKCQRQASARRSGRNQLRVSDSHGPSPRSSFSASSARSSPAADAGWRGVSPHCGESSHRLSPHSHSRSSSVASGDSSSADEEKHHGALAVEAPSISSLCSSAQHLSCWRQHRHGHCSQDELGLSKSSLLSVVANQRQPAATWSATFAQSLQIRPPVTLGTRGSRRTARSASTREGDIVLKHSVKLLDPAGHHHPSTVVHQQHHCASCCLLPPSPQPMLLSPPPIEHHYRQRRCFSVAKVDFDEPTTSLSMLGDCAVDDGYRRRRTQRCCSYGPEDEADNERRIDDGEEASDDFEVHEQGEEEAADYTTTSSDGGAMSDSEMDALVAEEKNQPKFSPSEPELSPEQLRQLFPELSEHWSTLTPIRGLSLASSLGFLRLRHLQP